MLWKPFSTITFIAPPSLLRRLSSVLSATVVTLSTTHGECNELSRLMLLIGKQKNKKKKIIIMMAVAATGGASYVHVSVQSACACLGWGSVRKLHVHLFYFQFAQSTAELRHTLTVFSFATQALYFAPGLHVCVCVSTACVCSLSPSLTHTNITNIYSTFHSRII